MLFPVTFQRCELRTQGCHFPLLPFLHYLSKQHRSSSLQSLELAADWSKAGWSWVISALLQAGGQQHSSVCLGVAGNTRDGKRSRAAEEMQNYLTCRALHNFQCFSLHLRGRNCFTTLKETLRLHMSGKVWRGLRRRWSSEVWTHKSCTEPSCHRTFPASLIPSPCKLSSNIPQFLVPNLLCLWVLLHHYQETKPSKSARFAKYILNREFRTRNYLPIMSQLLTFLCLILRELNI